MFLADRFASLLDRSLCTGIVDLLSPLAVSTNIEQLAAVLALATSLLPPLLPADKEQANSKRRTASLAGSSGLGEWTVPYLSRLLMICCLICCLAFASWCLLLPVGVCSCQLAFALA